MLSQVSNARRAVILQYVTDLFLDGASSYSPRQISIFDAVMKSLTLNIEPKALVELSRKLATMDTAPSNIIHQLSHDNNIAVAGVVLERSNMLEDSDLVEIAKTKSQGHLLAIAGRARIAQVVTDVLVDRGNASVIRKVTANENASLTERSFCKLVNEALRDRGLAEMVASRQDLPPELRPFLDQTLGTLAPAAAAPAAAAASKQA